MPRWVRVEFVGGPHDGEKKRYELRPPDLKPSPKIVRVWEGRPITYLLVSQRPYDDGWMAKYVPQGSRPQIDWSS